MTTDAFTILADNDNNSDGSSRYGEYLRLNCRRFLDPDKDDTPARAPITEASVFTTDPVAFALHALAVSTSPIMSPPYVLHHTHLVDVGVAHGVDHSRPLLRVQVGAPRSTTSLLPASVRGFADWERSPRMGWLTEPSSASRASAVCMVAVTLPLDDIGLPAPQYDNTAPRATTAKRAVLVLVNHVNTQLAPILRAITRRDPEHAS